MTSHTDSSPGNHTPETSGVAAPGETAQPTSPVRLSDEPVVVELASLEVRLAGPDTGSSFSTSSASSPPASRSGNASRSLRGLTRSSALLAYLPTLLFLAASESRRRLALGIDKGVEDGCVVNGGCS